MLLTACSARATALVMRPDDDDRDWTCSTLPAPASTRPAAFRGVWRLDAVDSEPTTHATLIEATCEPPRTPEAEIYGGGALLAQHAGEEVRVWTFTDAGMRRLAKEANGVL